MPADKKSILSTALATTAVLTSLCTILLIAATVGTYVVTGSLAVNMIVGDSMEPTVTSGDVVISDPTVTASQIEPGDIIRFTHPGNSSATIMHRVTAVHTNSEREALQFETQGDNNPVADQMAGMAYVQLPDIQSKAILSISHGIVIIILIPLISVCSLLVCVYRR